MDTPSDLEIFLKTIADNVGNGTGGGVQRKFRKLK